MGCGLGHWRVDQVRTAGLWGVGEREGKWKWGGWAEWTVGESLDVRCGFKEKMVWTAFLGCIGLKARLFVQVDCIEFLHARVYIRLGQILVYCVLGEHI